MTRRQVKSLARACALTRCAIMTRYDSKAKIRLRLVPVSLYLSEFLSQKRNSDTVLGWGSRPLVFCARYLAGRLERLAALPCVVQIGMASPVGGEHITRWVSFIVRGQSSPHRAMQRLLPGRARDHPVLDIVPNKALSLSLFESLSRSGHLALLSGWGGGVVSKEVGEEERRASTGLCEARLRT